MPICSGRSTPTRLNVRPQACIHLIRFRLGRPWLGSQGVLDRTLLEGVGWISGADEAFALRYPLDRLALLYCCGRAARQGHASMLLNQIEADARAEGVAELRTEASQLSCPLLQRRGWRVVAPETISIAGVLFERYRMVKSLRQDCS